MKKWLGVLFILIGVIVIAVPLVGRQMNASQQDALIDAFEKEMYKQQEAESQDSGARPNPISVENGVAVFTPNDPEPEEPVLTASMTDLHTMSEQEEEQPKKPTVRVEDFEILGIMRIPKLDVKMAIVEGVEMTGLSVAVGHFPQSPGIGEFGNTTIAGHRSYTFGEFFNRVDELKWDDKIYIDTAEGTYEYKVTGSIVVEPSEWWVLDDYNEEVGTLTLVTCTPKFVGSHRLIIRSELISKP